MDISDLRFTSFLSIATRWHRIGNSIVIHCNCILSLRQEISAKKDQVWFQDLIQTFTTHHIMAKHVKRSEHAYYFIEIQLHKPNNFWYMQICCECGMHRVSRAMSLKLPLGKGWKGKIWLEFKVVVRLTLDHVDVIWPQRLAEASCRDERRGTLHPHGSAKGLWAGHMQCCLWREF